MTAKKTTMSLWEAVNVRTGVARVMKVRSKSVAEARLHKDEDLGRYLGEVPMDGVQETKTKEHIAS